MAHLQARLTCCTAITLMNGDVLMPVARCPVTERTTSRIRSGAFIPGVLIHQNQIESAWLVAWQRITNPDEIWYASRANSHALASFEHSNFLWLEGQSHTLPRRPLVHRQAARTPPLHP